MLNDDVFAELVAWRRDLHRKPELSGQELETAATVVEMLSATAPDEIITGLGGHGVAGCYIGCEAGPTLLLRCELDALPIQELSTAPHRSSRDGVAHLCGHDGHMAIMAGVAQWVGQNRPQKGHVVLLFQPAEEDGSGAAKVIADEIFASITPDFALSLHNMPGIPIGHAAIEVGPMACASRGMKVVLTGRTAHASQPETGVSPALAIAELIPTMTNLATGGRPQDDSFTLATVTHVRIGEAAFGVAPAHAELWATLRTQQDATMDALVARAECLVTAAASKFGLGVEITYHDVFHHCMNAPEATAILEQSIVDEGLTPVRGYLPMRASEDFGRFGHVSTASMFLLGAGTDMPALHNPDYDFPDELIKTGSNVFIRALQKLVY
ncbi:MAG: amidohydrolase [Marivivens sp.]|uniref:amidohydrolase n=1 Tax=Marivivens sp. TaxID=1978374 RepID=UPI00183EEE49|nr:amidohydrolase [Marivivens sp.]NVJ94786.1 amidohydrolase [Marivivens sp.]